MSWRRLLAIASGAAGVLGAAADYLPGWAGVLGAGVAGAATNAEALFRARERGAPAFDADRAEERVRRMGDGL